MNQLLWTRVEKHSFPSVEFSELPFSKIFFVSLIYFLLGGANSIHIPIYKLKRRQFFNFEQCGLITDQI